MITKVESLFKKIINNIKKSYNVIVEYLLAARNRKQNLTIIALLIVMNVFLLNSFYSYAYYNDYSSFVLVHSKVGNVKIKDADYSLQIFLENQNDKGSYSLGESIPYIGYTYSGYNCDNEGTLVYDEALKTTRATITNKNACSIYFDLTQDGDITVLVKTESDYNSGTYNSSKVIPYYGYSFNKVECENGGTGTYNVANHYLEINSSVKDVCTAFFNKKDTNNKVNLFLEDTYQSGNYINRNSFIKNINYNLNNAKSNCKNSNGEIINGNIEYTNGEINITGSNLTCDIYMDRTNG